jgi:hypothetical protein
MHVLICITPCHIHVSALVFICKIKLHNMEHQIEMVKLTEQRDNCISTVFKFIHIAIKLSREKCSEGLLNLTIQLISNNHIITIKVLESLKNIFH